MSDYQHCNGALIEKLRTAFDSYFDKFGVLPGCVQLGRKEKVQLMRDLMAQYPKRYITPSDLEQAQIHGAEIQFIDDNSKIRFFGKQ